MYKVAGFRHWTVKGLEDEINKWIEENPNCTLITMSTIEHSNSLSEYSLYTWVTFRDHSVPSVT